MGANFWNVHLRFQEGNPHVACGLDLYPPPHTLKKISAKNKNIYSSLDEI
jgi:hypothetical protein